MARYAPLIEIVVSHAFYADGRCRGLRFTPAADTAIWLREVDAVCRDTGSGLLVLGDPGRLDGKAAGPDGLCWVLRCEDMQFAAVTDGLPAPGADRRVRKSGGAPAAGTLALAAQGAELLVFSGGAAQAWPLTWPAVSSQLADAERALPPLGLVQVPVPTAAATAGPARHEIHFAARAPLWKYCLVGPWSSQALAVVASSGAPVTFERLLEALPDGQPVLSFRSVEPIELRERGQRRFELRMAASSGPVKRLLPMAGADHFAMDGKRTLVAEIYVHS